MDKLNGCVLCGSTDFRKMERYHEAFLASCNNCNMVFCYRKPTANELQVHYDTYMRIESVSIATAIRFEELLDEFEAFRKTNNMMDVGCGNGHFLAAAKKRGWNVYGTEYADEAIKFCEQKGINMKKGELDTSNYPAQTFDVLISIEVIEHINYPQFEIENFSKLLRQGGLLYLTTPNFNSFSRYFLKEKWNIIEYPEHLCYYTLKTLNRLLIKHHFKKFKLITTGISPARFKQAYAETKWQYGQDTDNAIAEKTEQNMTMKWSKIVINFFLNFSKMGDTIKAWYVKA